MCAGLGATERAACRVGSAPSSQFAYLAADGARSPRDDESDARKLEGTRRALVAVGVEPAALTHLMQVRVRLRLRLRLRARVRGSG